MFQLYENNKGYILSSYQVITRHTFFHDQFGKDRSQPSYTCNNNNPTEIGSYLLVTLTNETLIKYSIVPQAYKVITNHVNEFSVWIILSRLLHTREPHNGGITDDVQTDLVTLDLKQGTIM